jgi:two-component system chemotaxis response regulator CheB
MLNTNSSLKKTTSQEGGNKTKVLVIDDSALMRSMLKDILQQDMSLEVVGTACDPYDAREKIKLLNPDVLTLDVEMPKMDGIQFLKNLMKLHPMPVVMISTLTTQGADTTLDALSLGAIDFISKPGSDSVNSLEDYSEDIIRKVKTASRANVNALSITRPKIVQTTTSTSQVESKSLFSTQGKMIAIGSSTGGTEALKEVLSRLPANMPSIVITQHIPEAFSKSFAQRMDTISAMTVCEAEDGQEILSGHVYIAPGSRHLKVRKQGAKLFCELDDGPAVNRHKPSVEVMLNSVITNIGRNAIGVMLTGMGDDGADAMKKMKDAGAYTFAQDEATSVVWGMPGQAVKRGAIDEVLPLDKIAEKIVSRLTVQ